MINKSATSHNILNDLHRARNYRFQTELKKKMNIKKLNRNETSIGDSDNFIQRAKKVILDPKIAEENSYIQNFIKEKIQESTESISERIAFKNNFVEDQLNSKRNVNNLNIQFYDEIGEEDESIQIISPQFSKKLQTTRPLGTFKNVFDSIEDSSEEDIDQISNFLIILPTNIVKKYWDYLIMVLTLLTIYETPYSLAFRDTGDGLNLEFFVNLSVDAIFCLDMIVTFFCAYYDSEERLITSRSKIALNYFNSWFILDIFSSVPISAIFEMISNSSEETSKHQIIKLNRLVRVSRAFRILKWFRIIRLAKLASATDKPISSNSNINNYVQKMKKPFKSFIKLCMIIITFMYFLSCLWVYLARIQEQFGEYRTWLYFTNNVDSDNFSIFIDSLYFNLVTILSIGYGDIVAKTFCEYCYMLFLLSLGVGVYSYTVSKLSTIFSHVDEKTLKYERKLNILINIQRSHDLPEDLFRKMQRSIRYDYEANYEEMNKLVETLPANLKLTMYLSMYLKLIKKLSFFQTQSYEFIIFVLPLLKPVKFMRKEYIVNLGDYFSEFYMITSGRISIQLGEQYDFFNLHSLLPGHSFGDLMMYINEQSPFNFMSTAKTSSLLILSRESFNTIKNSFKKNLKIALAYSYKFLIMIEEKHYLAIQFHEANGNLDDFNQFYKTKINKKRKAAITANQIERDKEDFIVLMQNKESSPLDKDKNQKINNLKRNFDLLKMRSLTGALDLTKQDTQSNKSERRSISQGKDDPKEEENIIGRKYSAEQRASSFKNHKTGKIVTAISILPKRVVSFNDDSRNSLEGLTKKVFLKAGLIDKDRYVYEHKGFIFCRKCKTRNKLTKTEPVKLNRKKSHLRKRIKNLKDNNLNEIEKFTVEKQIKRLESIHSFLANSKKF